MEETLASQKMAKIDLINNLEKISSNIPHRILKVEGFILKENQKEQLEILIFRGYSSSTTHPIQINKAQGQKCDRCWHYQKETVNGIQNTKLCKRCSNIINFELI